MGGGRHRCVRSPIGIGLVVLFVLLVVQAAGASAEGMTRPEPVPGDTWTYRGEWTRDGATYQVEEERTVRHGTEGAHDRLRFLRVVSDDDGPFSWHNETRWRDAEGNILRTNMTIVTREAETWRRIGVEVVYTEPCRQVVWPLIADASWTAACEGRRTVLGVAQPHQESTTYTVTGREEVDAFYAWPVVSKTSQGEVRSWYAPEACGVVQEEVQGNGVHVLLRLVSYTCRGASFEVMGHAEDGDTFAWHAGERADAAEQKGSTEADTVDDTSAPIAPADPAQEAASFAPLLLVLVVFALVRRRL